MTETTDTFLYLCHQDVRRLCQEIDSVSIVRDVFSLHDNGQTSLPDEAYLAWVNERGESVRSLNMPGYIGGDFHAVGTKIINGNPQNPTRGLPRASGLTLLFDPLSTRISCIMEAASISSLRTASVTVLAADLLRGYPIHHVAVIGSGELARAHIELFLKCLPDLHVIHLYDLEPRRIKLLQEALSGPLQERDVLLRAASSAEEAIRVAQLIVPVTTTTTGYIPMSWLQPGALLVNISLDDPLPEVVLQADRIIIDDWMLIKHDARRLLGRMYRQGKLVGADEALLVEGQRRIDAHLGEIVNGKKPGRRNNDEIILVNPFGLALEDVALAHKVYRRACEEQVGTWLQR